MTLSEWPNILLVAFDSLSAQDLAKHAGDLPTISACLGDSLTFTNAYAPSPEGGPARASLFTGLDMAAHGVWTDGVALPKRERPLPEVFRENGYHSWLVGRRQLAGVSNWTTEHARLLEYDHFDWAHGPLHRSRQNAYLTWLQQAAPETYADIFPRQADPDDTVIPPLQHNAMAALPDDLSFNSWVGQQVSSRINEGPFFGMVGFVVGQSMGSCGAPTEALSYRSLFQADLALAVILQDLPDNTVVALTAGRGSVANPARALHEPAIKVPLAIRIPNSAGQTVQKPVSTMDLAPTLYALAGLRPPQRIQGQCLITTEPRGWALSRLRHPDQPNKTALITERWKIVMTHGAAQTIQLFDLEADPAEAKDLSADPDHQGTVEYMLDQMIDARVALEDRTEPRIAKF
ncbi:sulfatase-like hydrolase/transferase [Planktomarina temperata]|nr:sulfatase-like hydrolase/transferase [Planktomarina temperata]MDC3264908.1 sulfatase-like hydrolase/transferase [Planktomarina temperata]